MYPDIQMASLPSCPHLFWGFEANSSKIKRISVSTSSGFSQELLQVQVPAGSTSEAELHAVESSSLSCGSHGTCACALIRPPLHCSHTWHSRWLLIKENMEWVKHGVWYSTTLSTISVLMSNLWSDSRYKIYLLNYVIEPLRSRNCVFLSSKYESYVSHLISVVKYILYNVRTYKLMNLIYASVSNLRTLLLSRNATVRWGRRRIL